MYAQRLYAVAHTHTHRDACVFRCVCVCFIIKNRYSLKRHWFIYTYNITRLLHNEVKHNTTLMSIVHKHSGISYKWTIEPLCVVTNVTPWSPEVSTVVIWTSTDSTHYNIIRHSVDLHETPQPTPHTKIENISSWIYSRSVHGTHGSRWDLGLKGHHTRIDTDTARTTYTQRLMINRSGCHGNHNIEQYDNYNDPLYNSYNVLFSKHVPVWW